MISGIDITTDLADDVIAELRRALFEYKVIFFRDQPLTADRHVAFARRFGELEVHPFIPGNAGTPELVRFEKSAEVGGYENGWHHDVTWRAVPSMGAVLHAIHVPASGGGHVPRRSRDQWAKWISGSTLPSQRGSHQFLSPSSPMTEGTRFLSRREISPSPQPTSRPRIAPVGTISSSPSNAWRFEFQRSAVIPLILVLGNVRSPLLGTISGHTWA